jgi:hypothetical protein
MVVLVVVQREVLLEELGRRVRVEEREVLLRMRVLVVAVVPVLSEVLEVGQLVETVAQERRTRFLARLSHTLEAVEEVYMAQLLHLAVVELEEEELERGTTMRQVQEQLILVAVVVVLEVLCLALPRMVETEAQA